MYSGAKLGETIGEAIRRKLDQGKAKSRVHMARTIGVRSQSMYGWIEEGSVSAKNLPRVLGYFSDVTTPEDWGLSEWPEWMEVPPELPERTVMDEIRDMALVPKEYRNTLPHQQMDNKLIWAYTRDFIRMAGEQNLNPREQQLLLSFRAMPEARQELLVRVAEVFGDSLETIAPPP